jgi:hypothetical protein
MHRTRKQPTDTVLPKKPVNGREHRSEDGGGAAADRRIEPAPKEQPARCDGVMTITPSQRAVEWS